MKLFNLKIIASIGFLFTTYFLSRLIFLKQIPWFIDETIYSLWAQQGFYRADLRLESLVDGKQPLFIWLITLMMNLFGNPITAGRIVSTITGAITLWGILTLTYLYKKNWTIIFLSGLLYVISPFSFILNRLALYDSTAAMFYIWGINFLLLTARTLNLGSALSLSFITGLGLLNRTSQFFIIYLYPLGVLVFNEYKKIKNNLFRFTVIGILSILLSLLLYSVIYLSPRAEYIDEKNTVFLYTLTELMHTDVIKNFPQTLTLHATWISGYFTLPLILSLIFYMFIRSGNYRTKIFIFSFFIIPFLALSLLGKRTYPRYLFFLSMPLFTLISSSFFTLYTELKKWRVNPYTTYLFILPLFINTITTVTNFSTSLIPENDKFQFANGWPSGFGMKNIIDYLLVESKDKRISVLTEGEYGSLPTTSMNIFFRNDENMLIHPLSDIPDAFPQKLLSNDFSEKTYAIFNISKIPENWNGKEIFSFKRGTGNNYLTLYEIIPNGN